MIPSNLITDYQSATLYALAVVNGLPFPRSNRDETGSESGEETGDETDVETNDDTDDETEGIEEGSGGLTGSSNGSPYEGVGVGPSATSSDDGTLIDFYFDDNDYESLVEGFIDAFLHVLTDVVGEDTVSPGPVFMVPKDFFDDFHQGGGSYDY
jgi:hypothetical protein